jgi:transposase
MTQNNVQLSKNEQTKIQQSYSNAHQQYSKDLYSPASVKNSLDEFNENHSFKLTHVLIIAGITYILLKNYQQNEQPFSDFVTSA